MRIDLTDQGKKSGGQRGQRPARPSRRKRTHFHSITAVGSITQPQAQPAPRRRAVTKGGPGAPAERVTERTEETAQWKRTRQAEARPRAKRPSIPAAVQPAKRIQWRVVLLRLVAIVGLGGLIGLIAYGSMDARFFVYNAQISGNQHLRLEDIYRAAGIHEQNIFWIRPEEVAQAIGRLNGIKAAHVSTALPAQVMIEIEERQPVVMWRVSAQQRDWWLDGEGVVLPYHGDVKNTIFVVDSGQRELHEGDRIKPEGVVASVQQLAEALPQVQVFFYQADRGLSFVQQAPDGTQEWPVYVGTSEDIARKIQILQTLTEYLAAHNIRPRYIDVRWADHPVYGAPGGQDAAQNG